MTEKGDLREFEVERFSPYKNSHILKLKGIDSVSRADELSGRDVFVPEEALKPLEKGRLYDFELIGCSVETKEGEFVGVVKDVLAIGESTLLAVDSEPGPKEVLIPLSQDICVEIDTAGKRVVIDPPDGLLDLNEI
ncbi:MAG: ribosome maturation factor RimM [Candidatus Aminicenantes bacterium]|nr:ribosome maturation factor RimM [Candidatus Aminicenantes bacterium]